MLTKQYSIILLFVTLAVSCGRFVPQTEPGQEGRYQALTIKLNVKLHQENRKGSGKILWFFDQHRGKMLFLSPLNQIYFELLVEREKALLISRKEKKYWKGTFTQLLQRLWNLEVQYHQLLALVNEGVVPRETKSQKLLIFNINKNQDSGHPTKIEITNDDVALKLKIARKKTRSGRLKFTPELAPLKKVDIEEILSLQY